MRDQLFNSADSPSHFSFNEAVAAVFPDMIQRSVPGYDFCLSQIEQLAAFYTQQDSCIYDLGCSLGTITLALRSGVIRSGYSDSITIHAVDSSKAMIDRASAHIAAFTPMVDISLHCDDILNFPIKNASLVVLAYTLQFIEPNKRIHLLKRIYDGLLSNGLLVLIDKVHEVNPEINGIFTELHHEFKRSNGYSELEISRKRQALENFLITESIDAHESRFLSVGFSKFGILAKHHLFTFWLLRK